MNLKDPHVREGLAWAAGFLDGEGYIRYNPMKYKGKQRTYGALCINVAQTQANIEPLQRLQRILGGHINGPYQHKKPSNQQPYYSYNLARFEQAQAAICLLWKWMGSLRREQAIQALTEAKAHYSRPSLRHGPKKGFKNAPSATQEGSINLACVP